MFAIAVAVVAIATDRSSAGPALAASPPSRCPSRSRSRSRNRSKAEHQFELRVNIITEIKSGILIKTQLHLQPQTHEQERGQRGVRGGGEAGTAGVAAQPAIDNDKRSAAVATSPNRFGEQQQQRRNLG